ncbi:HNH endonuclease signature motif containing protein [Roseovarius sp.]|uniref:HNH endonuclease signature motif containing protein n=1 Tax=Roseovarius sp. TaxID=1486281 RepID=UPI00356ABD83
MSDLFINTYSETRTCTYKSDTYDVRDNGAILRRRRPSGRHRQLDDFWTYGKKNINTGYAFFGSEPVHRIVATAFHGEPPTRQHIVDHIDTNRMNNRPGNLRWITKLENILLNPITLKRIIEAYGSVEDFFADPSKPKVSPLPGQFDWMRTVSASEAAASRSKLEGWANGTKSSSGGGLGEWLFEHRSQIEPPKLPQITRSLTEGALQANWVTPSRFPLCPKQGSGGSLEDYSSSLKFGETFASNEHCKSFVVEGCRDRLSDCVIVVCRLENVPLNNWGITTIYLHEGSFVHENKSVFNNLIEAMEVYAAGVGDHFRPDGFEANLGPSYGSP